MTHLRQGYVGQGAANQAGDHSYQSPAFAEATARPAGRGGGAARYRGSRSRLVCEIEIRF
jgi:hypothetical protein